MLHLAMVKMLHLAMGGDGMERGQTLHHISLSTATGLSAVAHIACRLPDFQMLQATGGPC